mgnify:CR=1 FL=1
MVVNEVNSDICILSVKTQKEANSVIINNDVDLFIIEINSNNDSFEFAKDVRNRGRIDLFRLLLWLIMRNLFFKHMKLSDAYAL